MRKSIYIAVIGLCLVGCSGLFTRGPEGEPSPWESGVRAAAESYDESPWDSFGPWGAGVAGLIAAAAGIRKGKQVYDKRKAAKEQPDE
jgi:hypothetical protein